jgi:dTDP-4-dehydrorhamnose 3,5-epimerase-like enzyme
VSASIPDEPVLTRGGLAVDDRGALGFVNDADIEPVRRFYTVRNHTSGFVRAWHGHRRERKLVTVVAGSALVCAVRIDDWDNPSPDLPIIRHVLSASSPSVLDIPAGYTNGAMSLSADAVLLYLSTSTLAESHGDDIRFPSRFWDPWHVEER